MRIKCGESIPLHDRMIFHARRGPRITARLDSLARSCTNDTICQEGHTE